MAATLQEAHFVSSKGDPDVWMLPATKPDGSEYYEYVLVYVGDYWWCRVRQRRSWITAQPSTH